MEENLDELHQKLKDMMVAKGFKDKSLKTLVILSNDTQYIPSIEELDDKNKGLWVEHDNSNFAKMFEGY
jgi:hypothetical protein